MPEEDRSSLKTSPEANTAERGPEEVTKSYYAGKSKENRQAPKQEFFKGDHVRHMDTSGVTHDCKVDEAKLEDGGWQYSLRKKTIDEPLYKNGVYIPEAKLVAC